MAFFLQPTLSSIAASKQSVGTPVSASSRSKNVQACRLTLLLPCFSSHKTKSLTASFWLLQQWSLSLIRERHAYRTVAKCHIRMWVGKTRLKIIFFRRFCCCYFCGYFTLFAVKRYESIIISPFTFSLQLKPCTFLNCFVLSVWGCFVIVVVAVGAF